MKIVFLDCDGTLTPIKSSWEYIHRRLNLWNDLAEHFQSLFFKGKIDYYEFCKRDAQLWKGLPLEKVLKIISEIPLTPGAKEMVNAFKQWGLTTGIISTGLSFLVNRVKDLLCIDFAESNELLALSGFLTGEIRINVEQNKKDAVVKRILNELGIEAEKAIAIGDGIGDISMFQSVGLPIGFNPDEATIPFLKHYIFSDTLKDLIPILERYMK
ncbi:MAG: HAD family phosphatase [Deltaproteobacteria bacterium]|nr:HAD family phosphatase [Deltaproteobacteria bacterium]